MYFQEIEKLIREIQNDKEHGASWLARKGLFTLKEVAERSSHTESNEFINYILLISKKIIESRPSMVSLTNLLGRAVYDILKNVNKDVDFLKLYVVQKCEELIENSEQAVIEVAKNASKYINNEDIIITHSYSSTVFETIKNSKNKNIQVIVTESRPLYEGKKLAHEIANLNIPTTLIIDSALGFIIPEADIAFIGADSVLSDGSIVNKVGSYHLALVAKEASIPFYVVCETFKFDIKNTPSTNVKLEEKEGSEIDTELSNVKKRNPYFDITPSKYIKKIITNEGDFLPTEIVNQIQNLGKYLNWYD